MKTTIQLPQGIFTLSGENGAPLAVVAGGRRPDPFWLKKATDGMPVYAADRGANHCLSAHVVPDYLYGDRDSAAPGAWEQFVQKGARVKTYPVNKDDTDLALILNDLPPGKTILATGIWGGRADHLWGNLYTLWAYTRKGGNVLMADEQEILIFLGQGETMAFAASKKRPEAVSLLTLTPEASASIDGVRWPLENARLSQERASYTISNKMTADTLHASCGAGWLGVYLTWKK